MTISDLKPLTYPSTDIRDIFSRIFELSRDLFVVDMKIGRIFLSIDFDAVVEDT